MLGESWTAQESSGLTSVGTEGMGGPTPLKELNVETFTLPREFGYVQEASTAPDSSRTVVHIQDAHCNYAAQRQISDILGYITKEYGVYSVNCEGGKGDYDLTIFTSIEEGDIRRNVSDFFVKEGVVNAAEFFAVNNPKNTKLWGVEDSDLYIKNLKIYRESLSYRSEVNKYIRSIQNVLDKLKKHIYSPELLDFDNTYNKYKDNQTGFKEYLKYLITLGRRKDIDIKAYPNIYLLEKTFEEEDKINFKKANNEKDEVVEKIKKVLSKNEIEELSLKVAEMKIERISQAEFYAYLAKKAKSVKLDIKNYPELDKYIIYVSIYSAIDRTSIAGEINALEDKVREALYENDAQRELGILSKNITLEKNIFNVSLTRDDYTYYLEHRSSFSTSNYIRFINAKAPLYKIDASLERNIGALDVYREKMESFYECSLERDKAFVKNIKFTDQGRPSSIIITGGFHTQNLRELFKKENVSYISIMPKFTTPKGYESPYLKRLAGQRTALENVIDTAIPAVLNLAVVNILSKELAMEVEGRAGLGRFELAVKILTALERNSPLKVKIVDKGRLTKGINDEGEKFITFTKAEGADAGTITATPSAVSTQDINAVITVVNPDLIEFQLLTPQAGEELPGQSAPQKAVAKAAIPATAAGEERQVSAKTEAELLYKSALEDARGVASSIRQNSATRILTLVTSREDKDIVESLNPAARKIVSQDTNVHLNSYVADDDWKQNIKEELKTELANFVTNDLDKNAPLMLIRIKDEPDAREAVEGMIDDILKEINLESLKKDGTIKETVDLDYIKRNIKLVQVDLRDFARAPVELRNRTNPAIDFLVDMGMLECFRYESGLYEKGSAYETLKDRFPALLKLSINNGKDFEDKSVEDILQMLFEGIKSLQIKPINFKTLDEWNRAQRQLLQSV